MARGRIGMRKIKDVLRLRQECRLSQRAIARSCRLSHSTVGAYLDRFAESGLSWAAVQTMTDAELAARLLGSPDPAAERGRRPEPDWAAVHRELRRTGVTLQLLWEEYAAEHAGGYRYSWFCERYRQWRKALPVVMRQVHRGGEKMFVDYAGPTVEVIDRDTGEVVAAAVFVAVLGASNYTFAEAQRQPDLEAWIAGHGRALAYFGGTPAVVVPDNAKVAVTAPCRYEPELNPTYAEWARHYGVAVVPARARRPRDKAKVEVGVQVVERWILARLRQRTFFSLGELNAAIGELLRELNDRPMRHLGKSRRALYAEVDRPALGPLPERNFEVAHWKKAKVALDYHVAVEGNYYSVGHELRGRTLEVRLTEHLVEIFHGGQRVASHRRLGGRHRFCTLAEHMPESHRQMSEWSPERFQRWGRTIGACTEAVVQAILGSRPHPEQAFRSCLGLLRLGTRFGPGRLEAACARARRFGLHSYRSVKEILRAGLDRLPPDEADETAGVAHANIRGATYYR